MQQWQAKGGHDMNSIMSSPDFWDNLHTMKIHYCGPVRHIIEHECCRIFAERNWDWNRVTFWLGEGRFDWSLWMRITEQGVVSHVWKQQWIYFGFAFCYNIRISSKGLDFPSKKIHFHKFMDILSKTENETLFLWLCTKSQTISTSVFLSIFRYFYLVMAFCGRTEKEQVLSENYLRYSKIFTYFRRM
jgi:hypothetical protein